MEEKAKTVEQMNQQILEECSTQDTFNTDNLTEGGEHIELSNEKQ